MRDHVKVSDIYEKSLIREIKNFTETGNRSEMFDKYVEELKFDSSKEDTPEQSILTCTACRLYVASLLSDRRNGAPPEQLADSAFGMCRIVTSYSEQVCRGIIDLNVPSMIHIVDARPSLTATQMCGLVLQGECGALDPIFSFTVSVNPGQSITQPKSVSTPRSPSDLKIIHVTDIHFDENYVEGNNANCIDPICCRRNNGLPTNPADAGGKFIFIRIHIIKRN